MDDSSHATEFTLQQVCYLDDISEPKAVELASKFSLLVSKNLSVHPQIIIQHNRVSISAPNLGKPISIDFESGKYDHRRKFGGGKGQPIAKAIGLKAGQTPSVIDATAGFARDAFVLASLGCQLTLLERNPVLATLLADALEHAGESSELQAIIQRMAVIHSDATAYLQQLTQSFYPDVIYMDPMYPSRDKSALVKKEMQLLHQLVGPDMDSQQLLEIARQTALKRVVVKRPKGADYIANQKPSVSIESKNTRYDVYVTL